ncbi:hypothetical protein [Aquimarina sp. AU119]|uniref:hypothetical protein n=1 Tax=Aquimarina sp. AU119 TaxID=2108528 RepID=UPI000D68872C|nr:hypothetical protein [Aquimarina sp. AU119]
MKSKINISVIALLMIFISCGKKISGDSPEAFKTSRLVVEKDLDQIQKDNLEKAFRVVLLEAMKLKWDNPKKYKGKSFEQISLQIIDNKTYNQIISLAESLLKEENENNLKELEEELTRLQKERKAASEIISKLETVTPTKIQITEGPWGDPQIKVTFTNTGDLQLTGAFSFVIDIYSIAKNIRIDGTKQGGNFKDDVSKQKGDYFTTITRTLSGLIERSKRLNTQLKKAKYPIENLTSYDLDIRAKAIKLTTTEGITYEYPEQDIAHYDTEIGLLNQKKERIKLLTGTLEELELTDLTSEDKEKNTHAIDLESIRAKNTGISQKEQSIKIDEQLHLILPKTYAIRKLPKKGFGTYILALSDSLIFDSKDKKLIQYQIQDTIYKEYVSDSDKANGKLNILKKENVSYDIKAIINEMKESSYVDIIDADESGYIIRKFSNAFELHRYFKIENTHYYYTLNFSNLEDCVIEFDRSKHISGKK